MKRLARWWLVFVALAGCATEGPRVHADQTANACDALRRLVAEIGTNGVKDASRGRMEAACKAAGA